MECDLLMKTSKNFIYFSLVPQCNVFLTLYWASSSWLSFKTAWREEQGVWAKCVVALDKQETFGVALKNSSMTSLYWSVLFSANVCIGANAWNRSGDLAWTKHIRHRVLAALTLFPEFWQDWVTFRLLSEVSVFCFSCNSACCVCISTEFFFLQQTCVSWKSSRLRSVLEFESVSPTTGVSGWNRNTDAAKCAVCASRNVKCWGMQLPSRETMDSQFNSEQQVRVNSVCVGDWADGVCVRMWTACWKEKKHTETIWQKSLDVKSKASIMQVYRN